MGVHGLWTILSPIQEHIPLRSLGGKKLAIDLSGWVCGDMCVNQRAQTGCKLYLRNLVFRLIALLRESILPIAVTDGTAPAIKTQAMQDRHQFSRLNSSNDPPKPISLKRSQFSRISAQCVQLLRALGVPCIACPGEAEAMCAFLDMENLVDGCVTNDGDVFLYGAKVVYRRFSLNSRVIISLLVVIRWGHSGVTRSTLIGTLPEIDHPGRMLDASVEAYFSEHVSTRVGLCRQSLVLLSLVLGCDYWPQGVPGVGPVSAGRILAQVDINEALNRLSKGSDGCTSGSDADEIWNSPIWRKITKGLTECPVTRIVEEFLMPWKERGWQMPASKILEWTRPNVRQAVEFCINFLDWQPSYALAQFIPLLALWIIRSSNADSFIGIMEPLRFYYLNRRLSKAIMESGDKFDLPRGGEGYLKGVRTIGKREKRKRDDERTAWNRVCDERVLLVCRSGSTKTGYVSHLGKDAHEDYKEEVYKIINLSSIPSFVLNQVRKRTFTYAYLFLKPVIIRAETSDTDSQLISVHIREKCVLTSIKVRLGVDDIWSRGLLAPGSTSAESLITSLSGFFTESGYRFPVPAVEFRSAFPLLADTFELAESLPGLTAKMSALSIDGQKNGRKQVKKLRAKKGAVKKESGPLNNYFQPNKENEPSAIADKDLPPWNSPISSPTKQSPIRQIRPAVDEIFTPSPVKLSEKTPSSVNFISVRLSTQFERRLTLESSLLAADTPPQSPSSVEFGTFRTPARLRDSAKMASTGEGNVWYQRTITISPRSRGCHYITDDIIKGMPEITQVKIGILNLFISLNFFSTDSSHSNVPWLKLKDFTPKLLSEAHVIAVQCLLTTYLGSKCQTTTLLCYRGLRHTTKQKGYKVVSSNIDRGNPKKEGAIRLLTVHTSCSITLNESWDGDVKEDIEMLLNRLIPENLKYKHACEGPDDMPAHAKHAILGGSNVTIPITDGKMNLGTWQGIWFIEHRNQKSSLKESDCNVEWMQDVKGDGFRRVWNLPIETRTHSHRFPGMTKPQSHDDFTIHPKVPEI
ncbi:hypothetical protein ACTXT7_011134 [Hymenolepis weldensis]